MDIMTVLPWLTAVNVLLTIGGVIYAVLTRGSKDNAKELESLRRRLEIAEREIEATKNELKHLPDTEAVHAMQLAISEIRGSMNVQAEMMGSVARTVQRLEGYLLERGK